ncbi:ATP-binding cassette domain-containing protein [Staphylococcus simiae]|uniref:ABC transporter ATP-binding protein n=1 Tax=Staphylococcus simiae TaxID=308354 RepID=UPI001A95A0C7|nr:ATP-binding cassette domain-containing protein [Staphylococcus simiae]MBO1198531.1 ATP-binding cassette domain-containing protein [Staphylococcus simiae]MBO1200671.1 ATP-binding cassette domain-containing protein [Staphylococcus simiae]MBO1202937.1 ATP-binding cassette domain-containing protein [Staphylococcus simiae]MBO1210522.1 ATP-binding cassette domain-containing protein [Staphylococcus simiae]MBO1229003.1 ATP-binding cassette domain-containing protein [Staphylococcus simiae]
MLLEIKDLVYKADDRTILDKMNLQVDKGETIAIVGPSGSGKSTLQKQICNLISPTSGELYFKGKAFSDYNPEELRRHISYLMQNSYLFGETIGDNLKFPSIARNDSFDEQRAKQLIKDVGLSHYNLDSEIEHMSGGERQRITIARQLMYIPDLLLLDESTSALDVHNKEVIEDIIFKLATDKGVAIMWITHSDDQSMRHFQKRMTIVDGKISKVEELKHNE